MTAAGPGGESVRFRYRSRRHGWCEIELECPDGDDHICRMIRAFGTFYEHELLRYLAGMVGGRNGLVIDVGANIGNHAVFFARFLGAHVIAIEPNPSMVPILERNLRKNAAGGGWEIVEAAAGSSPDRGAVMLPEDGANAGMAQVRTAEDGDAGPGVDVRTLDGIVEEHYVRDPAAPPVRLIKIDVEGMEPDVLEGSARTIERFAPDLVIEAMTPAEKERIDAILEPLGYAALSRHGATPVYHYVHEPSPMTRVRARLLTLVAAARRMIP